MDQIQAKHFTFVQAFYPDGARCRQFVVMTPSKPEARERATAYALARWGEAPERIALYPRTYGRDARALYAAGKHD